MLSRHLVIILTCRHILEGGAFCLGAASKDKKYCRHHLQSRLRSRRMARARYRVPGVELPALLDPQALQVAAARVRVATAAGHIDPDTRLASCSGVCAYRLTISLRSNRARFNLTLSSSITYL